MPLAGIDDHDYHFPKAGVDRADAFGRQPIRQGTRRGEFWRSTIDARNVRVYDPVSGRDRGGSRTGLSKLVSTQVNGTTWIVQHLNTLVCASQSGSGSVQLSQSGRVVILLGVSQGVLKVLNPGDTAWTAVTNNTGITPALNFSGIMQSAPNNQKMYFADGNHWVYYAPVTNSLETWTATAGTLPVDSDGNKPRLICTWRGRTMLSGLPKDPHNYFASRVSDPHDHLTGSDANDAGQAFNGNNERLGLIGDVVTGLAPWTDDVLVYGGDHSIYAMKGDPLNGGNIDLVSEAVGFAWGKAWAIDPFGRLFFFSNTCCVYRMDRPNSEPVQVSQPIASLLKGINSGEYVVNLIWDDHGQGLRVFVTKGAELAATVHYFWCARSNAWLPDAFANTSHNPVACCTFDGNLPDDRRLLIGGWDGYVRVCDPDATDDDGTAIASYVWIGPILTADMAETTLKELQAVLGTSSGSVTFSIHVGRTAEAAFASSAVVSGTWNAGRNNVSPIRRADHAIYIKISSTNQWALEMIRARFAGRTPQQPTRVRGRGGSA